MALTQKEIDALINSVLKQETGDKLQVAQGRLRVYDFKRPDKFSKDHLRGAQLMFDSFGRQTTSYFSGLLRMAVHFEVESIDQLTYAEFSRELSNPCCVAIVRLGELPSSMLVNAHLRVMLPMLDRLCGGEGNSPGFSRTLTEIEVSMVRRILMAITRIFGETLEDFNMGHNRPDISSIEVNPYFIQQIMAPSDMVLSASVLVRFGTQSGRIEFCLPYVTLEPVLPAFSLNRWFQEKGGDNDTHHGQGVSSVIENLEVPISCRLGKTVLQMGQVMSLQEGDVIEMDLTKDGLATLHIFGKAKFRAEVGILGNRLAARISSLCENGEGDPV